MPTRCLIESLESRQLLSGVHLSHGILTVTGKVNVFNTITVGLTPDDSSIVASVTFPTSNGPQTVSGTFPLTRPIRLVKIHGGAKADLITIDQTNGSFGVSTQIVAGAGDDTILGGDEPDRVYGGPGHDSIDGGAGNDTLHGGAGNDTLIGGLGDDKLFGGRGFNLMQGGLGDDTLRAIHGYDTLMGNDGGDRFVVRTLRRSPNNDFTPHVDLLHKVPAPAVNSFWDDLWNNFFWPF
jgi:Ca2+-binding RTX toxin-like protein